MFCIFHKRNCSFKAWQTNEGVAIGHAQFLRMNIVLTELFLLFMNGKMKVTRECSFAYEYSKQTELFLQFMNGRMDFPGFPCSKNRNRSKYCSKIQINDYTQKLLK